MVNTIIISQKLLKDFITQKKLFGIVHFLQYLQKKGNLKKFYIFCGQHNCKLQIPETLPSGLLFHGSQKSQSLLAPNASIGQDGKAEREAFVYATNDPNYAIFLALLNIKEHGDASVVVDGKKTTLAVSTGFVNGSSKIRNGYLHIVSDGLFKKVEDKEYVTSMSVAVLFTIPVEFSDLTVPVYIQA